MIDLVYENETTSFQEDYQDDFIAIVRTALDELDIEDDVELSVILVDDERIHDINRDYRAIDAATDVISFALEEGETFDLAGMPRSLGDIFISVDHAIAQAEAYGHSLRREMCFLFTHGLLHLLGYDHMTPEEEKEMFALQDDILGALDIKRVADYQYLVDEAFLARENAYAPYSHFKVGACVELRDGTLVRGCNIENAAYGSTICAERNAVFQAYCQGYRKHDIKALAIVADGPTLISPCGACRQVFAELLERKTPIILGARDHYEVTNIEELLPRIFDQESM